MGDNFHWGYFETRDVGLDAATEALIDLLAGYAHLTSEKHVLDIGCGIGEPARQLHQRFGCRVTGISNSGNGIERATRLSRERGFEQSLEFVVRDALSNGFPDETFDVAWLMEMSHLITDKFALVNEAVRSVKPGGHVVLCDLTFNRRPLPSEVFAHLDDHRVLKRAFGEAQLETLEVYQKIFEEAGLLDISVRDISRSVIPTLQHWKSNALSTLKKVGEHPSRDSLNDFAKSCDILEAFYTDGTWGYGCVAGTKLDSSSPA